MGMNLNFFRNTTVEDTAAVEKQRKRDAKTKEASEKRLHLQNVAMEVFDLTHSGAEAWLAFGGGVWVGSWAVTVVVGVGCCFERAKKPFFLFPSY